jgi:hypothetical protein
VLITAFGIAAATTMVVSYSLESKGARWIAVFAGGCLATAAFGVLTGAWIFAVLETIWAGIAVHRFRRYRAAGG